jgi:hypothetical protein
MKKGVVGLILAGVVVALVVYLCVRWLTRFVVFHPQRYLIGVSVNDKSIYVPSESLDWATGSILLFSGKSFAQAHLRALLSSYFDHSALLINSSEKEGRARVWESDVGQNKNRGVRVIPLRKKLKRWKGYRFFVLIQYTGPKLNTHALTVHIQKYAGRPLEGCKGLFKFLFPPLGRVWDEGKFCSELTYKALMDVGVAKIQDPWMVSPGQFMTPQEWALPGKTFAPPRVYYF